MKRLLLEEKRKLERAIDGYLTLSDLLEAKILLYRELALAIRLRIKIVTKEIVRRFLILQNKIEELKTWSRVASLKTLENTVLESKLINMKAKYEEEMSVENLEKLVKLAKLMVGE